MNTIHDYSEEKEIIGSLLKMKYSPEEIVDLVKNGEYDELGIREGMLLALQERTGIKGLEGIIGHMNVDGQRVHGLDERGHLHLDGEEFWFAQTGDGQIVGFGCKRGGRVFFKYDETTKTYVPKEPSQELWEEKGFSTIHSRGAKVIEPEHFYCVPGEGF